MKKSLGQHFLKNKQAVADIISALEIKTGDLIIEIGPGPGTLTVPLSEVCEEKNARLMAIEKDEKLASQLKLRFAKEKNVEIISGDALTAIPELARNQGTASYKIVGNIPYYITGFLLRTISELEIKPARTVLMIQKEVAERVAATPPEMSLSGASTQVWGEVSRLFSLKPSDFIPPPKVHSSVILITPKELPASLNLDNYYALLHAAFKQPRKTLLNNLSESLPDISKEEITSILQKIGLSPKVRPQNLGVEELELLSSQFRLI